MEKVLLLCHPDAAGALPRAAKEALTAAQTLSGGDVVAAVFGSSNGAAVSALKKAGVARVLVAEHPELKDSRYATDAAAAAALVRESGASLVVLPGTSRMMRIAAGVAQRLEGRVDTHVTQVASDGGPSATRWFYRQRIEVSFRRKERPWFLVVDPGAFPAAAETGPANAAESTVAVDLPPARTKVLGERSPTAGEETIKPDAKLLLVAGAGWTKKQADGKPHPDLAETLVRGFLRGSGASLGSSKSLVDQAGEGQRVFAFMTHLNQVGQTGSTPRHPKGLATCCHGEEPHVVGWRFIRERRAVNLDPNCGWARGKADVLYVADAFALLEKVNALLTSP